MTVEEEVLLWLYDRERYGGEPVVVYYGSTRHSEICRAAYSLQYLGLVTVSERWGLTEQGRSLVLKMILEDGKWIASARR